MKKPRIRLRLKKQLLILRLKEQLLILLYGGKLPVDPSDALWKLIDNEKQKPENEIRCDYIEAWVEAAERVQRWKFVKGRKRGKGK